MKTYVILYLSNWTGKWLTIGPAPGQAGTLWPHQRTW